MDESSKPDPGELGDALTHLFASCRRATDAAELACEASAQTCSESVEARVIREHEAALRRLAHEQPPVSRGQVSDLTPARRRS